MFILIIFLMCIFVTIGVGILAAASDMRRLLIPNTYCLGVIAAFVVAYGTVTMAGPAGVFAPLLSHLLSAGIVFLVTLGLFALRVLGAGDSKFATACALWFGAPLLPIFLFYMALAGAVLGGVALYIQRRKPFATPAQGGWIDQIQNGQSKIPYGVAITFGMVVAFIYAGYVSSNVMSSFITSP